MNSIGWSLNPGLLGLVIMWWAMLIRESPPTNSKTLFQKVNKILWHGTHNTRHITSYMWQVTPDTWQVTCDMWHRTYDTGHMTDSLWWLLCKNCRALALTVWERLTSDMWHMTHGMWHMTGGLQVHHLSHWQTLNYLDSFKMFYNP